MEMERMTVQKQEADRKRGNVQGERKREGDENRGKETGREKGRKKEGEQGETK